MNNYIKKYESEELKEISLTSNIKGYKGIIVFIFTFIALTITISALIKYPEKILGKAFIVSGKQVNNVYSPNSGEIIILVEENKQINEGDLLALINNPTNYTDLIKLKMQLESIDIYNNNLENSISSFNFEKDLKLGEIEKYYYNFLLSLLDYNNVLDIDITSQKIDNLNDNINRNIEKLKIGESVKEIINKKSEIIQNSYAVDSSLFSIDAIVEDKMIESKLNILNSKEKEFSIQKSNDELIHYNKELKGEIQLLKKEKLQIESSVLFKLKKSFFELKTAIDFWEYNYVIKAPVSGKIEFYQPFLNSTQYVKKDTPLFILLPKAENLYARGIMSAEGYGKIKTLDTIFIKLKDYGELEGIVSNKSKVYHDSIYYMNITLPHGLKTNHDKNIEFSYNMAGEIEYFTNKRSILQRIFSEIQNSFEN